MVWCARESADFAPSDWMVDDSHYGWIHWGGATWHTVTGHELGQPGQVPGTEVLAPTTYVEGRGHLSRDSLHDLAGAVAEKQENGE